MEKKALAWEDGERDEVRLLRGVDLSEAQSWLLHCSRDIGKEGQRYIQASQELQEREKNEKEQRRKRYMQYLAAFSILALAISSIAIFEWNQADKKTEEALSLSLASQLEQINSNTGFNCMRRVVLAVESLGLGETAMGDLALRSSAALLAPPLFKMGHNDTVRDVAFSPDGRRIVTGSADGTAWVWPVSDKDLIKQACDCMSWNFTIEDWERYGISDPRTCPKEGRINQSAFVRFLNNPRRFLTSSAECLLK